MGGQWASLGLLLILSFEMVVYMVCAVFIAKWLNGFYIINLDWINITIPLSLLLCSWSLYRFFGKIIKISRKKS